MPSDWPSQFPGVSRFDDDEDRAVLEVLSRRAPFRYYGVQTPDYVLRLENTARQFYGVKHALAVGSGTGALMTAMAAMDVGPGDEVVIPAFMWVATVSAVVHNNAVPVLCEVDDSFTMDPADLQRKITGRTKLIVPVHMAGVPCDMERIMAVADGRGIPVLEDCAQANGATFGDRAVGTFGRAGMFSFQVNKNVTAGEGGLIVTDDDALYDRVNAVHDVGVPWVDGVPRENGAVVRWGQGRRMSELCGAVASVQLTKLRTVIRRMRRAKDSVKGLLEGTPGLAFRRLNDEDGDTGPFLVVVLDDRSTAERVVERVREAGLSYAHRVAQYGLHIYFNIRALVEKAPLSPAGNPWSLAENAASRYDYARGACPQSDALFDRSVLVSISSSMTEEYERKLADAIRAGVTGDER